MRPNNEDKYVKLMNRDFLKNSIHSVDSLILLSSLCLSLFACQEPSSLPFDYDDDRVIDMNIKPNRDMALGSDVEDIGFMLTDRGTPEDQFTPGSDLSRMQA